jgi:hypothetical protein
MADNLSLLGGRMPTQQQGPKLSTVLQGLQAAYTGQGPQFQQQMRAEEQYQRQSAMQDFQMQETLAKSAAQDAVRIRGLLGAGNVGQAINLLQDRISIESRLGVPSTGSQNLISALRSGDPMSVIPQIDATISSAQGLGILPKPEKMEGYTLAAGATRYGADNIPLAFGLPQQTRTIVREEEDPEVTLLNEQRGAAVQDINEQLADAGQQITLADDVQRLVDLLNKEDRSLAENFVARRFGLTGLQFIGAGPESQAAKSLQNYLAPRMRPTGSGSTSDIEVAMYLESLPAFLQSAEARQLTADVFKRKGQLERKKLQLRTEYYKGDLSPLEYITKFQELQTQSVFDDDIKNRSIEIFGDVLPDLGAVMSRSGYVPQNPNIRPAD